MRTFGQIWLGVLLFLTSSILGIFTIIGFLAIISIPGGIVCGYLSMFSMMKAVDCWGYHTPWNQHLSRKATRKALGLHFYQKIHAIKESQNATMR